MTETRNPPTDNGTAVHPQGTRSTVILVSVLSVLTIVFIIAGLVNLQPVIKVFYWLALVL